MGPGELRRFKDFKREWHLSKAYFTVKPGDLVRFDHTMWPAAVGGRIALVLDVLMDGAVVEGLINSRWNRSPDEGIEILVQSCATAVGP